MSGIEKTKKERGQIYGDYLGATRARAVIMKTILDRYKTVHGDDMAYVDQMRIWDVVNKLSRLAVTPDHIDTWHDISVYAN